MWLVHLQHIPWRVVHVHELNHITLSKLMHVCCMCVCVCACVCVCEPWLPLGCSLQSAHLVLYTPAKP